MAEVPDLILKQELERGIEVNTWIETNYQRVSEWIRTSRTLEARRGRRRLLTHLQKG